MTENSALTQNWLSQTNAGLQTNVGLQTNSSFQQQANKPLSAQQSAILFHAQSIKDSPPDPYTLAFMNARFNEVKPTTEPLPAQLIEAETTISHSKTSLDNKQPLAITEQPKANRLVQVELFNLLIGDEKAAIYNKAQLLGAISLPKQREWKLWRVATGVVKDNEMNKGSVKSTNTNPVIKKLNNSANAQQIITFLIPPEFGRLASGSIALVEMASPGELNIARYKIN